MSTWRRYAIECLPQLREQFENRNTTIYDVFVELRALTVEAHKQQDAKSLKLFYEFAEWCLKQKTQDLWNAASVSFYEHLGDTDETFLSFHLWIKRDIYEKIRGLLELRINREKMDTLDIFYYGKPKGHAT